MYDEAFNVQFLIQFLNYINFHCARFGRFGRFGFIFLLCFGYSEYGMLEDVRL